MAEKLTIRVDVDEKGAVKGLKVLEKQIDKTEKEAEKGFADMGRAFDNFTANIASAAVLKGFAALSAASSKLFQTFIVEGVAAAQTQEQAILSLNAALAATGELTPGVSQGLQDFASALQQTTGIGDEVILQNLALAQGFTENAEAAKELTAAAADFAAGAQISFEEAIRRLGRASQGSVDDVSKFAKGIKNLTKEQLATGGATDLLAKRFRGAAEALSKDFAGSLKGASNDFGDLTEEIGFLITKNPAAIAAINELGNLFKQAGEFVKENREELIQFASDGIISIIQFGSTTLEILGGVERAGRVVAGTFNAIGTRLGGLAAAAVSAAGGEFKNARDILVQSSVDAAAAFEKGLFDPTFIDKAAPFFDELAAATAEGAKRVQDGLTQSQVDGDIRRAEIALEKEERLTMVREEQAVKEIGELQARQDALRAINEEATVAEAARLDQQINSRISKLQRGTNKELQLRSKQIARERALDRSRLENTSQFFGDLSSLQRAGNKDLFVAGKVFAIAQATVDGALAIQKALASAPPPFNFLLAAATAVKTGVQIATISSQTFQRGIDSVPGTGTQDTVPALLAPGERVVPRETNRDLTRFLATSEGTNELLSRVVSSLENIRPNVVVEVGGREITSVIREELEDGRRFA